MEARDRSRCEAKLSIRTNMKDISGPVKLRFGDENDVGSALGAISSDRPDCLGLLIDIGIFRGPGVAVSDTDAVDVETGLRWSMEETLDVADDKGSGYAPGMKSSRTASCSNRSTRSLALN
jgi:hypothetical protein